MRRHLPWIVALVAAVGLVLPPSIAQTVISNNAADMSNHIVMVADSTTPRTVTNAFTYTGLQTFNRGAAAPFAVNGTATKVTTLDVDKLDGQDWTSPTIAAPTVTGTLTAADITFTGTILGKTFIPKNRTSTSAANVGTGETTLATYTLPAATLVATNDSLRVRAWGQAAANANTHTFRLYFGATVVATRVSTSATSIAWIMDSEVIRTGAATQVAYGMWEGVLTGMANTYTTPAETLSGTIVVKMTGQSDTAGGDITLKYFSVDYLPTP